MIRHLQTLTMTTPKTTEVNYESRAHRMISRWAGVRGKVRTDEERKVTEIFTDRYENGTEPEEYIIGNPHFVTKSILLRFEFYITIEKNKLKVNIYARVC